MSGHSQQRQICDRYPSPPLMPRNLAIALLVVLLALSGCGGDDDNASDESTATPEAAATQTATPSTTETPQAPAKKPKVKVPNGKAPKELVIKDLREGTGPAAQAGQTVTVQYVGVNFKGGKQFDASWDRGEPFSFPLGGGQVIQGWDQGVQGMKVGGRRMLVIPPDLGYGPEGSPPVIKPNETLVFVIDLLGVQ
jgi:peptidylprolyl isomerase